MTGIGVIVIVTRFSFSSNVENVAIKVKSYVDINNNEPATVSPDDVAASVYTLRELLLNLGAMSVMIGENPCHVAFQSHSFPDLKYTSFI